MKTVTKPGSKHATSNAATTRASYIASSLQASMHLADVRPLAVTPRPHERESMMPYALRLTQENGYPTPSYFLKEQDDHQFSPTRHITIDRLAKSACLTDDQCQRLAYFTEASRASRLSSLLGHHIGEYELRLDRPRVCPLCVETNGIIEGAWDLAWITCCPIHRVKLIHRCPLCNEVLTWSRPELSTCKRGHRLLSGTRDFISQEEAELAGFFMNVLYTNARSWKPVGKVQAVWASTPLLDICRIAVALSHRLSWQDRQGRRWIRGRAELFNPRHVSRLHAVFCGTREQRYRIYEELMIDPKTQAIHSSFHSAFRWLLSSTSKERARVVLAPLLRELFEFASLHWPHSRLGRSSLHFREFVVESQCLSTVQAAKELDISLDVFAKAMKEGHVPHRRVHEFNNHSVVIPLQWVRETNAISRESYMDTQLRNKTGLNLRIIDVLRDDGLVEDCFFTSRSKSLRHDIDRFVEKLFQSVQIKAEPVTLGKPDLITFNEAMRLRRVSHGAKAHAVRCVLSGDLKAIRKPKKHGDVAHLVFDRHEMLTLLDSVARSAQKEMTHREASRVLKGVLLVPLLRDGHLKALRPLGSAKLICAESVMAFHRAYIPAARIVKKSSEVSRLLKVSRFVGGMGLLGVPDENRPSTRWFVPREFVPYFAIAMKHLGCVEEPRPNSPKEKRLFAEGLRMTLDHMRRYDLDERATNLS